MSATFGQQALVHVARAAGPITDVVRPLLGSSWAFVPGYTLFFIQIFAVAVFWIRYVTSIDRKKVPFLGSCAMSSVHAAVCLAAGFTELREWAAHPTLAFHLDVPNTPLQSLLLQYSLSYLIADTFYFLAFSPGDVLFLGHHVLAGTYLVASLYNSVGGISAIFVFFVGEVTSPLFNVFSVAKELRGEHPVAARALDLISPLFTFAFVLVRSIISPVLIGWFLYVLWAQSPGIPAIWRAIMVTSVALGLAGSQLWSYKLIKGWRKRKAAKKGKTE